MESMFWHSKAQEANPQKPTIVVYGSDPDVNNMLTL